MFRWSHVGTLLWSHYKTTIVWNQSYMAQQLYLTQFIIKQNLGTLCCVLAYDTSVGHFSRSRTSQERSALDLLVVCNAKCAEPTRKLLSKKAEIRINVIWGSMSSSPWFFKASDILSYWCLPSENMTTGFGSPIVEHTSIQLSNSMQQVTNPIKQIVSQQDYWAITKQVMSTT